MSRQLEYEFDAENTYEVQCSLGFVLLGEDFSSVATFPDHVDNLESPHRTPTTTMTVKSSLK